MAAGGRHLRVLVAGGVDEEGVRRCSSSGCVVQSLRPIDSTEYLVVVLKEV